MLYTWRLLGADGCIEQQAGELLPFGSAVTDAIRNGFRHTEDDWMVDTAREVTHHQRGRKPLVVLKKDPNLTLPPPSAAGPIKRASEKSSLPEKQ